MATGERCRIATHVNGPLVEYFLALGFNDIHIQPAYGIDGYGDRGAIDDIGELSCWYATMLSSGLSIAVAPFYNILRRLIEHGRNITSWYPCATGHSGLGVDPDGDIYPCHHFTEEPAFRLGNVASGLPGESVRATLAVSVDEREPCRTCWARHACGGECYHRAHSAGRGYAGVLTETCDTRRSVIGIAIALYARLARYAPETFRRLVNPTLPCHNSMVAPTLPR